MPQLLLFHKKAVGVPCCGHRGAARLRAERARTAPLAGNILTSVGLEAATSTKIFSRPLPDTASGHGVAEPGPVEAALGPSQHPLRSSSSSYRPGRRRVQYKLAQSCAAASTVADVAH